MTILTPIYYTCTSDRRSNTLRTAVAAGNLVLSAWFMVYGDGWETTQS